MKNFIHATRTRKLNPNDPQAALFRDTLACNGSYVSRQSSTAAAQSELEVRQFARNQLDTLDDAIQQQRGTHLKLLSIMRDTEHKHKGLIRELEEEKRKHERDTAQGDDITYGLEMERTRLRQELVNVGPFDLFVYSFLKLIWVYFQFFRRQKKLLGVKVRRS